MRNGYFKLDKRPDGTYLIIYPPEEAGTFVDGTEIVNYLDGFKLDFEKSAVYEALKKCTGPDPVELRLTTLQLGNIDEILSVDSPDGLAAMVRFYPPEKSGSKMTYEDVVHALAVKGIKSGLNEDEIRKFLRERQYCTTYVLAEATLPEEGRDAVIEYHFNTDLTKKPKLNEDGSVDFHQLDTVSHVEKDMVLATLTPAIQGKPGVDVKGVPIKPRNVQVKFLRQVKHAHLSPDGLQLICDVNGHVMLVDGQIFISDTYTVPANVDPTTGDIDYNGNVQVEGNVNTGYKVTATGDIIVNGIVEGAELNAGGQIILKRGIQGMARGKLTAGTNIVTKFIESAEVSAGGFVQTESIMHSTVTAGSEIIVKGKKGFITGGSVRSGKCIEAKTIGSVMGTNTVLEVGVNMNLANKLKQLEAEKIETQKLMDRDDKIILHFTNKIKNHEEVTPERLAQFQQVAGERKELDKKMEDMTRQIENITVELDNATGGYILVDEIIYPGCKVTVSNVTNYIRTETKHARLVRDGADVRVAAY